MFGIVRNNSIEKKEVEDDSDDEKEEKSETENKEDQNDDTVSCEQAVKIANLYMSKIKF